MFDSNQEQVEQLLRENENFREIYNQHQQLHKRIMAAETGTAPMDDHALTELKKQKLHAKDELSRMMDEYMHSAAVQPQATG